MAVFCNLVRALDFNVSILTGRRLLRFIIRLVMSLCHGERREQDCLVYLPSSG